MTEKELKDLIRCIHRIYYEGDFIGNAEDRIEFHNHMCPLFDYAEITETRYENHPGRSPEDDEALTRAKTVN